MPRRPRFDDSVVVDAMDIEYSGIAIVASCLDLKSGEQSCIQRGSSPNGNPRRAPIDSLKYHVKLEDEGSENGRWADDAKNSPQRLEVWHKKEKQTLNRRQRCKMKIYVDGKYIRNIMTTTAQPKHDPFKN